MPSLKEWLADRRITLHERTPKGAVSKLAEESKEHSAHMASLGNVVSKPLVKDSGPVIDSRNMPAPILRDTRGIRVRTMAGKLPRHGERPNHDNAIRTQSDGTTQVIVYHPRMDWVDMHGAFVALRERDVKALPPKLRRVYERAKHRASVANNGKPE